MSIFVNGLTPPMHAVNCQCAHAAVPKDYEGDFKLDSFTSSIHIKAQNQTFIVRVKNLFTGMRMNFNKKNQEILSKRSKTSWK